MLGFADVEGIRPTADRVRETLFNWLQSDIVGAICLDLFAGSGALGFEALSRGAVSITSLEISSDAARTIEQNTILLPTEQLKLKKTDALVWLDAHEAHDTFDIVFLDPPFASNYLEICCELLESKGWLKPQSYIYLESDELLEKLSLPENWTLMKNKRAGQVFYGICKRLRD